MEKQDNKTPQQNAPDKQEKKEAKQPGDMKVDYDAKQSLQDPGDYDGFAVTEGQKP